MGQHKGDSGKSSTRKEYNEKYPKAFGEQIEFRDGFDAVLFDATQEIQIIDPLKPSSENNLYANNNKNDPFFVLGMATGTIQFEVQSKTMKEIIRDLRDIFQQDMNPNGARTIIINWDKQFTPLSKAPTQRKRRETFDRNGAGLARKIKDENGNSLSGVILRDVHKVFPDIFGKQVDGIRLTPDQFRFHRSLHGANTITAKILSDNDEEYVADFNISELVQRSSSSKKNKSEEMVVFSEADYGEREISSPTRTMIPHFVTLKKYLSSPIEDMFDLNKRIHPDWKDYLAKKSNARPSFIRFFNFHLLSEFQPEIENKEIEKIYFIEDEKDESSTSSSKRIKSSICLDSKSEIYKFIIDGHFLTRELCIALGMSESEIPNNGQKNLECTPISLSFELDKTTKRMKRVLKFEHSLYNELGETDNSAFHYLNAIKNIHSIKYRTTDTDLINFGVVIADNALSRLGRNDIHIFVFRNIWKDVPVNRNDKKEEGSLSLPAGSNAEPTQLKKNTRTVKRRVEEWVYINELCESIKQDKRLKKRLHAPTEMAIIQMIAGCDHLYPWYFVNHKTFLESYLEFSPLLKSSEQLITINKETNDFELSPENFVKIVGFAYAYKFLISSRKKNSMDSKEVLDLSAEEIREKINSSLKDEKQHFPSSKALVYSYKQVKFMLKIVSSLGRDRIDEHAMQNLREYGYGALSDKENIEKGLELEILTKKNIERIVLETGIRKNE